MHSDALAVPINAATDILGIGRSMLYKEIAAGRLKTFTVGTRRLISRSALEAWVKEREAEAENVQGAAA